MAWATPSISAANVTGTLPQTSPSLWNAGSALRVGATRSGSSDSPGSLSIAAGAVVTAGSFFVGAPGSTGAVSIDGKGSSLSISGNTHYSMIVGNNSAGVLTEDHGAALNVLNTLNIGELSGVQGEVSLDHGSTLNSNTINIGENGIGALHLSGGSTATITHGYLTIGDYSGANGVVTVSGPGTSITQAGEQTLIGDHNATGSLQISDGGQATGSNVSIGVFTGSTGTVSVTGSGSGLHSIGNLTVGNQAQGSLTVANGATATASGTLQIAALSGSTGILNIGAAAGDAAQAPGTVAATGVVFGLGNGTVVFNHTDNAYVFAPTLSGNGTVEVLAGTTIFNSAQTYTGGTIIAGGTLDVTGSLASNVTVESTAVLTGTGQVGNLNVLSGGTLTPAGASTGTFTVNGNLNMAPGATFAVDITDTGTSDLLHATGTASVAGATTTVLATGAAWTLGRRYTVLTAEGGVTGEFATLTSDFAFLTPTLGYDAQDVYLTLARNSAAFASIGDTENQQATGAALQSLGPDTGLYQAILPLTASAARAAFDSLAGANLASTQTAIIEDSRYVRDAIGEHLLETPGVSTSGVDVWSSAWGHWGNDAGNRNATAQHDNGSGLVVGVDGQLPQLRVGALVGQHQLDNSSGGGSQASSTATDFGLYASSDLGAVHLQGGGIYSWYDTHSHRAVDFAPYAGSASARYSSGVAQGFFDAGYRVTLSSATFTPFVNVARVALHQEGFEEHHSGAALDIRSSDSAVTYGTLGLRAAYAATSGTRLSASLGEQHAWGDLAPVNQQRFAAGGDSFQIVGVPIAREAVVGDLGVRFAMSPALSLAANAHGQVGDGSNDHDVRLSAEYRF